MKPERWQQINELFHAALERKTEERAGFVAESCAGDESLRHEVETLIACHGQADSFIETPAVRVAAPLFAEQEDEPMVGRTIGRYRILSLLGQGGMGEVYLAQDLRLGRRIALKLLPAYLSRDKDRLRRFEQEARAASTISHPNVCMVHEVGETEEGRHFITMEYVEGMTLRQQIANRRLKVVEMIEVASQVAAALAAAHRAGIVHRDIKPENIMVRPDGYVKVLDFGLAKLTETGPDGVTPEAAMTALVSTKQGLVMGTASYMSPEQARGLRVDARTDVWSLGVVIYEMVSGRTPFEGSTTSDVIASILTREPPPLAGDCEEGLIGVEQILKKALCKERGERYQGVKELLTDLKSLRQELESAAKPEGSVAPGSSGGASARGRQMPVGTAIAPAARSTPSAGYLTSAIKLHKRGTAIAAIAIAVAVATAYFYSGRGSKATIDSMAILPFVNVGADPDMEYLSDGMAESLINSLSQLPNLRMVARSSVFRYKGRETDPQVIGHELGVKAILIGRIVQRGDTFSISVELVDTRNNSHIWGGRYNRKLSDLIAVQEEISKEISEKLRSRLTGVEQKQLTKRYTDNLEAYQLYLKGRYFWNKRTEEGLKRSVGYFRQAIEKDSSYALAYAGLADSYGVLAYHCYLPPKEPSLAAKAAAMKALEIDDTLAEAHTALADIMREYDWDWSGAEREYQRAIETDPNYATAHQRYSLFLMMMGRTEESIKEIKRAQELDPLSLIIDAGVGWTFYLAHQYDQAIEQYRKTLELDRNFMYAHWRLGQAYERKGMYEEAIAELNEALQSSNNPEILASLGYVYAMWGKRDEARKVLDGLKELSKQRYVSPRDMAIVYAGLGEKDQSLAWLEKAYEGRNPGAILLLTRDPYGDSLRSDPRFTDLVRRAGLAP